MLVIVTMAVFLGVVMLTLLFGVLVTPRFDRLLSSSPARPAARPPVGSVASRSGR